VSFILDALRKSEHERQRSALPGLSHVPLATPSQGVPRWAVVLIGVLGAAVLVLGVAWWQSTRAPVDVAAPVATVERSVTLPPAPATITQPTNTGADRSPAPRDVAAPEPAGGNGESALASAAAPPTPTPQAAPGEASLSPPAIARPAPAGDDEPVLPSAAALLAQGIVVPPLHLELLRYREQPQDRFVFINGRKYVEGERLAEGPQVVSIVPAGAVLAHAGRRFMLVSE
jgi:general secretion pathway protein B